ncbi:MAG TPA: response regulator [Bacillota bacterium]|nr:response regulator [Bacillota bacterium]
MGKRVLVVDDAVAVQRLLRMYLERAGYAVDTCGDGGLALARIAEQRPDLVILDLLLPGMGGLDVCRRLRSEGDLPVIMLTARSTEPDRLRGLKDGADDYVTKPFSPAEVVLRVEAVLRRAAVPPEPAAPLQAGKVELDPLMHRVAVAGHDVNVTPTEFRLLHTLMAAPGRTFTRQQLLDHIAGPDFAGFDRNVDVHVANLRKKLGVQPSPVRTVYGVGYRYLADQP